MDAQTLLQLLQDGGLTVYPLGVASVITLAILFERMWRYKGLESRTRAITRETIESLVRRDVDGARANCEKSEAPISKIFLEAMRWKNIAIEDLDRVLFTARQESVTDLKRGLWVIGTIGSLAPYVGLFGTVWGIMTSFHQLASVNQATIAMVAPGISEALIATAMGLFAAIPAVIAYNRYSNDVERLISRYDIFMDEFSSILHRHAHS